jgi:hypothetical protein
MGKLRKASFVRSRTLNSKLAPREEEEEDDDEVKIKRIINNLNT